MKTTEIKKKNLSTKDVFSSYICSSLELKSLPKIQWLGSNQSLCHVLRTFQVVLPLRVEHMSQGLEPLVVHFLYMN